VAQTVDNTPAAILAQMQDVLRQLRASGRAEVVAGAAAAATTAATSAWVNDTLYVDVFTRSGLLRVDVGADVASAAAATASYGYRVFVLTDTGGGETMVLDAALDRAVNVTGAVTVGCSRATRATLAAPGQYRVRGATRLTAGTATITNRSLTVVPR
jgi:hypothetical protein